MYNGYTPTTEFEQAEARCQILRVELTEAMGSFEDYMKWSNSLDWNTSINRFAFVEAAEAKLAEIEQEAARIIGAHFSARQASAIKFTELIIDDLIDSADLIDTQECARW